MLAAHPAALRSAVRLEIFTVAWMLVEAALSLGSGVVAGSILLVAFGLDSVLELVSGGVLLWRLSAEAGGRDVELVESIERTAIRVVAVTLVLLCIYVLASSLYGLAVQSKPESSAVGVGISAAAVIVMPWLALQKRRLAGKLGSDALAGDAAESLTCGYMAGTVLVGVGLNALFGWWWVEDAAALVFLFWLGRETWEAFEEAREQGTGASSVEAR